MTEQRDIVIEGQEPPIQAEKVLARAEIFKRGALNWAKKNPRPAELKQLTINVDYFRVRGVSVKNLATLWGDCDELEKAMEMATDMIQTGKTLEVDLYAIDGDFEHRIAVCSKRKKLGWSGWYAEIGWAQCI